MCPLPSSSGIFLYIQCSSTTMNVIEFYHSSSYHEGRGGNYMKIMQLRRMLRTSGENEKGF